MPFRTEIKAEPYVLRRYRLSDIDALCEAAQESIPELQPWMPWCHANYGKKESRDWINYCAEAWDSNDEFNFGVFDTEALLVGGCGLNTLDWLNRRANLGYWTRTRQAKKGVATAATKATAAFGFSDLKLDRMEIVAAVGNLASRRVAEKVGALREGTARHRLNLHGVSHDAIVYSLVASG